MPRKKSTPPAPTPDNSGFDVPDAVPQRSTLNNQPAGSPEPSSIVNPPSSSPAATPHDSPITDHASPQAKPSPVNVTPIVKVPKHAFLRLQRMQTEKAKQEQLRQLARRHPVIRNVLNEVEELREGDKSNRKAGLTTD